MFHPVAQRIVYANTLPQKDVDKIQGIEFVRGLDKILDKENDFDPDINNLLVWDHLMDQLCDNKKAAARFTRDIHHRTVMCLFSLQNWFKQG